MTTIMQPLYILRGLLHCLLLMLSLLCASLLCILFWTISWIIPLPAWRLFIRRHALLPMPRRWSRANTWISYLNGWRWLDTGGQPTPKKHGTYLLIANHVSWIDILSLGHALARSAPPFRFLLKKQLLWTLPLAGIAMKMMGFAFLGRYNRQQIQKNPALRHKDAETLAAACQDFAKHPTTIITFAEGTRFTQEKHAALRSPYKHLLPAKGTGTSMLLQALHNHIDGIIDVTISYEPQRPTFWAYACGRVKKAHIHYDVLPVPEELTHTDIEPRLYRKAVQRWLNDRWTLKDQQLNQHMPPE